MAYLKDGAIRDDTTTPGLQEARRKLEFMSMTEQERREYRDYMVSVHAAKDAWDTAVDEAKAKGWEEGREKGQADEKANTARKMKADGMSADIIAKYTHLPISEIEALCNS